MTVEELRRLRLAVPFRPFELETRDGRRFLIDKPPYFGISPAGNVILVATGGENVEMLKPEWVTGTTLLADAHSLKSDERPQPRETA